MALPSTIFKAELQISDIDRHYYATHTLTVARHSSETDERMMVRILAFALNASEQLSFAQGLSSSDEPDLWAKDFDGTITQWIMVGLPDERQIKKACARAKAVSIYAYGGSSVDIWWSNLSAHKFNNLAVFNVSQDVTTTLANHVERSMKIQCSIQDGTLWWNHQGQTLEINCSVLKKTA